MARSKAETTVGRPRARSPRKKAPTPRRKNGSDALYQAALELIVERGYHSATTAAISKRAGMSAAALYAHYSSKEELAWQLFLDINKQAALGLREKIEGLDSASSRIRGIVQHVFEWTMDNRHAAIFLFLIRHSEFFEREKHLDADGRAELVQMFMETIEYGWKTGELPKADINTLLKATGVPLVFVRDWLEGWDPQDLRAYIDDATHMCCRALGMRDQGASEASSIVKPNRRR